MEKNIIPPILEVGGVLLSSEIITECFCCDYEKCKGICCVEGDAGAPVTLDEIAAIEDSLDTVWADLSASAQSVIDRQGVAYADRDGDMVTSIVRGKDCVFTCYEGDNCLCALERAYRQGKTRFCKPISCSLYPIREKNFGNGLIGLNYHRWEVCRDAVIKGKALGLPVYQFLKEPLIRRFGESWYEELCQVATLFETQKG
jgi:hypothetical protein